MDLKSFQKRVAKGDILSVAKSIEDGVMNEVHKLTYPPLVTAVMFDKLESVKTLVEIGNVDINAVDRNKSTALSYAIFNGCIGITDYLFEQGADPTILDVNGQDCLFAFAVMHRKISRFSKISLLKKLLFSCDVNAVDVKGYTAFEHYNTHHPNDMDYEMDTLWLDAGVDITNKTTCECFSPK